MPTRDELKILQALPLDLKIMRTQQRIREWVTHYSVDGVCVSFSGGKDSTVLLHIERQLYPDIKAVFSDTGLEYPSIREFVKTIPNVDWVKPKMNFRDIVTGYGYPLFSKEIAETIRFARKMIGSTAPLKQAKLRGTRLNIAPPEEKLCTSEKNSCVSQSNCRRKKISGVFRRATGRE